VPTVYGQIGVHQVTTSVDPTDGHETLTAACPTCADLGGRFTPQVRWDTVKAILDEMAVAGERRRIVFWR